MPVDGQTLIDTSAAGAPQPAIERSFGHTPWKATYPGGSGKTFWLVNVGNEIRMFEKSASTFIARGKTATGLSGDAHAPYSLSIDPILAMDGFRYGYFNDTSGGVWAFDGATGQTGGVISSWQLSGLPNAGALARVSNGKIILVSKQPGNVANAFLIYDPSNPSISPLTPASWPGFSSGSPYYVFPTGVGFPVLSGVQRDGPIDPDLDRFVLMSAFNGQGQKRTALVNLGNPDAEPVFFGQGEFFDKVAFGKIQNDTYAVILESSSRMFRVFRIDATPSTLAVVPISAWISGPTIAPNGASASFSSVNFLSEGGLLGFGDAPAKTLWVYDVFDPTLPVLIPGVADWWWQQYGSKPYYETSEVTGADSAGLVFVSAGSLVHTAQLTCDVGQAACDFSVTFPAGGVAYPGDTVTFAATGAAASSYWWDFGDGSANGSGPQVTHVFCTPGTRQVTLTTTSPDCQVSKSVSISTPTVSASAAPHTALVGVTVVSLSNTHTGNPIGYQWRIFDPTLAPPDDDVTALVSSTISGSVTSPAWNVRFTQTSPVSPSPVPYQVCLSAWYCSFSDPPRTSCTFVYVANLVANFTWSPSNPTTATDLVFNDQSVGSIQSVVWSVTGPAGFSFTPTLGNGTCSTSPCNLTLPKATLVPCPSGTNCYEALLKVGSGPLQMGPPINVSGEQSSVSGGLEVRAACTSASFIVSQPGGSQLCDSGASGTTSCGQSGGTCGSAFLTGQVYDFTATCSFAGTTYFWEWGDGTTDTTTATTAQHTYSAAGSKIVRLTVNGTYSDVICLTVSGSCQTAAVPTLTSPANGATNVSYGSGVLHSWTPGANNSTYNLNHYSGYGCSSLYQSYMGLSSPNYTIASGAFSPSSTYSWHVTPFNSCGTQGSSSSCYSYTVGDGGGGCTAAPPAPALSSPANGATSVVPMNVTFSWATAGTGGNTATSYDLVLRSGSCGGSVLAVFSGITGTSYTVGSLPADSVIFWNISATNACGTSAPSTCFQFTTAGVPSNDSCSSPVEIVSTPFHDSRSTVLGSTIGSDPTPSCGNGSREKSVWYRYVAPFDGPFWARTTGSAYDTILSAYTGVCAALTPVAGACNDDAVPGSSFSGISFHTEAGSNYLLLVSAYLNDGGLLEIRAGVPAAPVDFDGDRDSEIVIHRDGAWFFYSFASGSMSSSTWTGPGPGCVPAPLDFDGDEQKEFSELCGPVWHFMESNGSYAGGIWTGGTNDRPVPADYDGDGIEEAALYRNGAWMFFDRATGAYLRGVWTGGGPNAVPLPIDSNGDGKMEISVFDSGVWHFYGPTGSYDHGIWTGISSGGVPIPGDFDGDGFEEAAIYKGGAWYFFNAITGALLDSAWTGSGSIPVPIDVDGDGDLDLATYGGGALHFFNPDTSYKKGIWTGGGANDQPISRRPLP